jgi:hypothetical protein
VSLLDVQSQLYDALAAASDAMTKEGGAVLEASGALDLHTENGRKAADVLLDVRNSGNELIATMIQQGATTADVAKADLICGRVSSTPRSRWDHHRRQRRTCRQDPWHPRRAHDDDHRRHQSGEQRSERSGRPTRQDGRGRDRPVQHRERS